MEKLRISPLIYVILLGFSLAFLLTSWFEYNLELKTPIVISNINQDNCYKRTQIDYAEILRKDIFGIKRENSVTIKPVKLSQNIQQEKIQDLKLLGILKGQNSAYALILWHGEFFTIKKGQIIKGLQLISIEFNKAKFSYNGQIYTFKLSPSGNSSDINNSLPINYNETVRQEDINKINSSETYRTILSRQEIQERIGDINHLINSALFQPFYLDNKLLGYRIRFIRPGALLFRLGLRPGDIITGINDESLKNPQVFFNLFSSIKKVKTVVINLIRNGQKKTIIINIK